jgi:hypothetical protein
VRLVLLIRGKPRHAVSRQDAVHRGAGDRDPMEAMQVRRDSAWSEVIVLAQIENLADHLPRRGSRRSLRRPWPIAQPGVTVLGVSPLPLVERLPGNSEPAADSGHILLRCRVL